MMTKTKTECLKDSTYDIFSESRGFKDIKYHVLSNAKCARVNTRDCHVHLALSPLHLDSHTSHNATMQQLLTMQQWQPMRCRRGCVIPSQSYYISRGQSCSPCKKQCFVAKICKYALYKSSEGLICGRRKPANPWHPGLIYD